jgi:HD-like signal output (HDOD) protein
MLPSKFAGAIDLGKLPSGPRVLARLITMIRQPGVQLDDVAELFRSDPALTARVMAASNSAYYAPGEPTTNFQEALLRLGLEEVSRIVHIVSLTDLRRYPAHLYTQTAGHFWERSLHTAFVMDEISGRDPYSYTAGIMHLAGIWVLCSAFPPRMPTIAERELALQARLEHLRMGVSFAEAGALALTQWGFAQPICAAVDRQLTPSISEDPGNRLALLLNRAIAITDWHYGAKNQNSLVRSDLTITDLEDCNARASAKVTRVGFGF